MKIIETINHLIEVKKGKTSLGVKRSSKWRKVRDDFIKENYVCAVCGSEKKLEVHHIKPFDSHPELELEKDNLITLCDGSNRYGIRSCHLLVGHLGNYRKINPYCLDSIKRLRKKIIGV